MLARAGCQHTDLAVVAAVFASVMLVQYPHHDRGATAYRPAQPTWPVWLAACSSPGVANVCCVGMPPPPLLHHSGYTDNQRSTEQMTRWLDGV